MAVPARSTRQCGYALAGDAACQNDAAAGQMRCEKHGADLATPAPAATVQLGVAEVDELWHLSDADRELLAAYGVDESTIAAYPRHLSAISLPELIQAGISPAEAARWPDRFVFGNELVYLIEAGLQPEQAALWPQRFSGGDIADLFRAGLTAETAAAWPDRWSSFDVTYLTSHAVGAREASAYPDWMSARQVVLLLEHGLGPDVAATIDPASALSYNELAELVEML